MDTHESPAQKDSQVSASSRARHYAERALDLGKELGFGFELPERLVAFWKRIGFVNALIVVLAISIPVLKYQWIPYLASSAAQAYAASYGVELETGDWSADLWDLRATAEDVRIRTHGTYSEDTIFQARGATINLSFWQRLRRGSWVQSVEVDGPSLYLERLLSGRWNWEDLIEAGSLTKPAGPQDVFPPPSGYEVRIVQVAELKEKEESHGFEVPRLHLKGLRVQWVENLPGQSGGGLIHSSRAILFFDDVNVDIENLTGPLDERDAPMQVTIEGRTADGRLSINGRGNLFHWGSPASMGYEMVSARQEDVTWSPQISAKIYLENVGTAALAQMVPAASLRATTGAMTGFINIALRNQRVDCTSDLTLQNVRYAANPLTPRNRGQFEDIQDQLDNFSANGRIQVGCEGDLRDPHYRPFQIFQTAVTREAVKSGPPIVRQAAAADYRQASTGSLIDQSVAGVTDKLAGKAGDMAAAFVGKEAGAAISSSLAASAKGKSGSSVRDKNGNPVTRGAKGVGSAVKRLFGGGRKKPN